MDVIAQWFETALKTSSESEQSEHALLSWLKSVQFIRDEFKLNSIRFTLIQIIANHINMFLNQDVQCIVEVFDILGVFSLNQELTPFLMQKELNIYDYFRINTHL